jgi:hypothetical protein
VFVNQEQTIGIGPDEAQARFANLIRGNWLTETSEAAYGAGAAGLIRVGPLHLPGKLVRVTALEPIYRDGTMNVGLRWEATGATGGLFPVLDATLTISAAAQPATSDGAESSRLILAGSYRPPLGRLGAGLDTALLHRVANATIRALLHDAAVALTRPAQQHAAGSADVTLRLAPETETP